MKRSMPDAPVKQIVSIKIALNGTKPEIWRRVSVPASVNFFDLHHIIQISMGWKNSHLFEFHVGDYRIGYIDPNEAFEDIADASEVTLDVLLLKEGFRFTYLYDFGDDWRHTVEVEEIREQVEANGYPVCTGGELACPPEDCGGIPGFYENLSILNDKKHPERASLKKWLGRGYDPEKFDIERVNKELPRYRAYMKHWRL